MRSTPSVASTVRATFATLRKNDAAARAHLEQLLDHASYTIRYHAVNALADLGGSRAALERRRKVEKNAEVRGAIAKALKNRP